MYNQIIRRLGKEDRLAEVFEVLDRMAALGVENDHETLEFVTNAAVKEVEFETRAVSMKTLPSGERVGLWVVVRETEKGGVLHVRGGGGEC